MAEDERAAHKHWTAKVTHGRSEGVAQAEAITIAKKRTAFAPRESPFSNDPHVRELARDGVEAFIARTEERRLAEHGGDIYIHRCPKCGKIAETPKTDTDY